MEEEWRPINSFLGHYEVSNKGNVRSITRKVLRGDVFILMKGRILKPVLTCGSGYPSVCLKAKRQNPSLKREYIHRLVAEAFIGAPIGNRRFVNHINFIRQDNRVENLEWVTPWENSDHARRSGRLAPNKRGVIRREDGKRYESITSAAKDVGAGIGNVCKVLKGEGKTACGFSFSYI